MKIFITGCCGFIGFNFANFLAKTNKKIHVVGIDNFSDYYSVSYKKKRLKELVQNRNFKFYKIDINQNKKLIKLFAFVPLIFFALPKIFLVMCAAYIP